jgi:8-oxo-dGTP diphosphatase
MRDEGRPLCGIDTFARELRVIETSARVEKLPSHDAFALAVGFEDADEANRFVMVHSAKEGRAWELPGGKVEDGETFLKTACREFREETGRILEKPRPCAVIIETYESSDDERVVDGVVFAGEAGEVIRETDREVDGTRFVESLPDDLTHITFDRETFKTLVEKARRTVNEDTEQ